MNFETLVYEENDQIGLLKINRPKALNALNAQVLSDLEQALDEINNSKTIRCLILTGEGEKSFVAGADIKEFVGLDAAGSAKLAERGQSVFRKLEDLRVPVIAAVNGFALGGGLELALACDFIVCSNNARFGLPEVSLGIMPAYGGTQRLKDAIGVRRAREMTFTGGHYKADRALEMGLVNQVTEPAELLETCKGLAVQICAQAPLAVSKAKATILVGLNNPGAAGFEAEAFCFGELFETKDASEGVSAFVEKRKANFVGE